MTKREWLKAAALGACGCVLTKLSSGAAAEPPPTAPGDDPPGDAKDSDISLGVDDIVTAYRTADWARRVDPPSCFALVAAAQMLDRVTLFDGRDDRLASRIVPPKHALPTDLLFLKTEVEKLIREAVATTKEQKQDPATVRKLIESIRSLRGGLNGPLTFTCELSAGEVDVYPIKCRHGEWERIAVRNTGASLLQLRAVNKVGDSRADEVGLHPYVAFVPFKKDGSDFTVTVTNRGKEKVVYQLFCN